MLTHIELPFDYLLLIVLETIINYCYLYIVIDLFQGGDAASEPDQHGSQAQGPLGHGQHFQGWYHGEYQ